MAVQFIYFDLGNVVLNFDHDRACRNLAELSGATPQRAREIVYDSGLEDRYERGDVSSGEFAAAFNQGAKSQLAEQQVLHAASAMFELNAGVVPLVAQLRAAGYRLGLLSNTCAAHWEYVSRGRYRIVPKYFPVLALSYELRAMKPAASIYQAAARLAGARPEDIFFVDDREENVAGARAAGFDAVMYRTPSLLAQELRARGVRCNY